MPDSVEAVIPWRGGCPHREAAFAWMRRDFDLSYRLGECPDGPWIKALAVMPQVEQSEADIIVLHDADVSTTGLSEAVAAVQSGAHWAVPHQDVVRLNTEGSEAFMAGEPWEKCSTVQRPYWGIEGGGILVARRETLLECPLDPRFIGWGQEDHSLGIALYSLYGKSWRGSAPLIHLFHPPPPRLNRKMGSEENWGLFRRYVKARYHPDEMKALLQEARDALDSHQPALHAHSAHVLGQR